MSNSSEYVNSLYEAMKTFADYAKTSSNSPLTIECKIIEQIDAGLGSYKVSYLTNTFTVFANANLTYNVGDIVYVLVPEGDFSKEKFILGSTSTLGTSYVKNSGSDIYDISDNLIDTTLFTDINLNSYKDYTSNDISITAEDSYTFGQILSGYINDYNLFKLSINVKTALPKEQQFGGNYGISLVIPTLLLGEDNTYIESWESINLDTFTMLGTPYLYNSWNNQSIIFKIKGIYDNNRLPKVKYFNVGFNQADMPDDYYDIFIKDICLKAVNQLTAEDTNGYKLTIKASEGQYYISSFKRTKTLTPTLRINGNVTSIKDCSVYWFIEDRSIKLGKDGYSQYGGNGWKCLNQKSNIIISDDGSQTFSYKTNVATIDISQDKVSSATRFKCVVLYGKQENVKVLDAAGNSIVTQNNSNISEVSGIIILKNLESNKYTKLKSDNANNIYATGIGYATLSIYAYMKNITNNEKYRSSVQYGWSRYDLNGSLINDEDSFFKVIKSNEIIDLDINNDGIIEKVYQTDIQIPVGEIDTLNSIYCTAKYIYIDDNSKIAEDIIGTSSLTLNTSDDFTYNVVVNNGNKIYKYDADGDSPAIEAYDGPAASKVNSIQPLSFNVFKKDGTELNSTEYLYCKYIWEVPKQSMVNISSSIVTREDDNYYYIEGYGNNAELVYNIETRFNKTKSSNSIILTIEYDNETISTEVPMYFIKDGESGSNGTSYAAILVAGVTEATAHPYGVKVDGRAKKIKCVYSLKDNLWYTCKMDTNELKTWDSEKVRIFPRVYYNGNQLDNTNYTVKYSMFDDSVNGKAKPCFNVVTTNTATNAAFIELKDGYEITKDTVFTNIVQAEIVAKNISANTEEEQTLYAYYPIDVIIVDTLAAGQLQTLANNGFTFPVVNGGFYDVLYSSSGTNPSYDQTNNFYIDEVINPEAFSVSWKAQNHLTAKDVMKERTAEEIEAGKPIEKNEKEISITPDNAYLDGNTLNYVEADISILKNVTTGILITEKEELEAKILELENKILDTENLKNSYNNFGINWDPAYLWTKDNLTSLQVLLEKRFKVYNSLTEFQTLVSELLNYLDVNTTLSSLQSAVSTLLVNIGKAKDNILNPYKDYYNVDLITVLTAWNKVSDAKKTTALKTYIAAVESLDAQYDTLATDYYNYATSNSDLLSLFKQISLSMNAANALLKDDFLKDSLDKVINTVYSGNTSLKEFKDYFSSIETSLLDIFVRDSDKVLTLSDTKVNELDNAINDYSQQIDKAEARIIEIGTIVGVDYLSIRYIRPIVISFNRYELSMFNAWDGNKISIDENSYLLAPQIGAGEKNEDNTFTGLFMGPKLVKNGKQTALFAYNHGKQTIKLSADNGSAIFGDVGSESGQIIIDPTSKNAYLYCGKFFTGDAFDESTGLPKSAAYDEVTKLVQDTENKVTKKYTTNNGMIIDLSSPAICFGSGKFKVTPDGTMIAGANTADGEGGSVSGWKIGSDSLMSNNFKTGSNGIQLSSRGYIAFGSGGDGKIFSGKHQTLVNNQEGFYLSGDGLSIGSRFKVSADGTLELGTHAYDSGSSAHWIVSSNSEDDISYIRYNTKGATKSVYISTNEITLGSKFKVSNEGVMYIGNQAVANGGTDNGTTGRFWTISGSSTNSYISFNTNTFKTGTTSVYVGTDGISLGTKFSVDNQGNLSARNADIQGKITTSSGTIGGWTIGSNSISAGNLTISSTGNITSSTWSINSTGAEFSNVKITGGSFKIGNGFEVKQDGSMKAIKGSIGGWTISEGAITSGDLTISSAEHKISSSKGKWSLSSTGLTATSGNIGGWKINSNGFQSSTEDGEFSLLPTGVMTLREINAAGGVIICPSGEPYIKGLTGIEYQGQNIMDFIVSNIKIRGTGEAFVDSNGKVKIGGEQYHLSLT